MENKHPHPSLLTRRGSRWYNHCDGPGEGSGSLSAHRAGYLRMGLWAEGGTSSCPPRSPGPGGLTLLSSCSWAVRSATCCFTCLCSVVSFSSFSFILFKVCIISSFSWVLASHSRSFFSNFCCNSLCSTQENNWT